MKNGIVLELAKSFFFPVEGQIVTVLGFMGPQVSVPTRTHFCSCSAKAAIGIMHGHSCVPMKL